MLFHSIVSQEKASESTVTVQQQILEELANLTKQISGNANQRQQDQETRFRRKSQHTGVISASPNSSVLDKLNNLARTQEEHAKKLRRISDSMTSSPSTPPAPVPATPPVLPSYPEDPHELTPLGEEE
jgi:hypothetical protein